MDSVSADWDGGISHGSGCGEPLVFGLEIARHAGFVLFGLRPWERPKRAELLALTSISVAHEQAGPLGRLRHPGRRAREDQTLAWGCDILLSCTFGDGACNVPRKRGMTTIPDPTAP